MNERKTKAADSDPVSEVKQEEPRQDSLLGLDEELALQLSLESSKGSGGVHPSAASEAIESKFETSQSQNIRIQVVQRKSFQLDANILRKFPHSLLARMFTCKQNCCR